MRARNLIYANGPTTVEVLVGRLWKYRHTEIELDDVLPLLSHNMSMYLLGEIVPLK